MKRYEGYRIQDDGAYMSEDAVRFCRSFRSWLARQLKPSGIKIKGCLIGHYDMNCYAEKDGKVLYVYYGLPRHGMPISITANSPLTGVLVRRTEAVGDSGTKYTNHFTSIKSLPAFIIKYIDDESF